MSIERSLLAISRKTTRSSSILRNEIQSSVSLQRVFEKKSLRTRKKLVEERRATLLALSNQAGKKDSGSGAVGGLLGILGLGGGSRLLRSFGGGPKGGGGWNPFKPKGPILPSNNIRPTSGLLRGAKGTRGFRVPGLKGLRGGIGPLAVLTTGLDFMGRKAEGQTNLQAGVGAGGGLAGALAGGAAGAKAGAVVGGSIGALFGGVGAAPGAAIGGFIGGVGGSILGSGIGSGIADFITGADGRRKMEEKRVIAMTTKSSFSHALDDFDRVLDKFALSDSDEAIGGRSKDERERIRFPFGISVPKPKNRWYRNALQFLRVGMEVLGAVSLLSMIWAAAVAEPTFAGEAAAATATPGIIATIVGKLRTLRLLLFRGGLKIKAGQVKVTTTNLKRFSPMTRTVKVDPAKMRGFLSKDSPLTSGNLKINPIKKRYYRINKDNIPNESGLNWSEVMNLGPTSKLADGGPVIAGKPYIVGEIGEELFIPEEDGYIVSNADLPASEVLVINNGADTVYIPHVNNIAGASGSRKSGPNSYAVATKYAQMAQLLTT